MVQRPVSSRSDGVQDSDHAPLVDVDLAVLRRVQRVERPVQSLRLQQKLQIFLAAVLEEVDDLLVALDALLDLLLRERAAVVDVDHREDAPRRAEELGREGRVLGGGGLGPALLLVLELRDALREAALDGLLPCVVCV